MHPHNVIVDGAKHIPEKQPAFLVLRMSAAGLPKMDLIGHCDAYVVVSVQDEDAKVLEVARTEAVTNEASPHWKAVSIPWELLPQGKASLLTLRVYDRDLTDEDDAIGFVRVSVEAALSAGGGDVGYSIESEGAMARSGQGLGTLFFSSKSPGARDAGLSISSDIRFVAALRSEDLQDKLPPPAVCITGFGSSRNAHRASHARLDEQVDAAVPQELVLRMSATGLPKMDLIGHCDAYVVVSVQDEDAKVLEVARTEAVTNEASPHWKAVSIPWELLPQGKASLLTLRVYDRDLTDEDDAIGFVRVSVEAALSAGGGDVGYSIESEGAMARSGQGLGTLFFSSKSPGASRNTSPAPTEVKSVFGRNKRLGIHEPVPSISPLLEVNDSVSIRSAVAADVRALSVILRKFAESSTDLGKLLESALLLCQESSNGGHATSHNHVTLSVLQAIETSLGWQQGAEGEDVASLVHYVHEGLDSKGDPALVGHKSIHTVTALLSEAVRLLTDMARFGPQHHREAVCCRNAAAAFVRLAGTDVAHHAHPAIFALCELVLHFGGAATVSVLNHDGLSVLVHTTLHHTSELGMKASQALGVLVKANDDCRASVLKAGAVQALLSSVKSGVDKLLSTAAASRESRTVGAQVTSSMAALRQLCEFPAFQHHIVTDGGVGTLVTIFNGIVLSDALSAADRSMLLGDAAFVAASLALVPTFRLQLLDAGIIASVMTALAAHKFLAGEWRRWTGIFFAFSEPHLYLR